MLVLALAPAAAASPAPENHPGGGYRACDAITATGTRSGEIEKLETFDQTKAIAHAHRYGANTALATWTRGTGCDLLVPIAQILLAPDERVALELQGWRVDHTQGFRVDGVAVHEVRAARGKARLVYWRRGRAPRVSHSVYRAGQTLDFPRSALTCTSGFVLRLPTDGQLLGLSAGHCSALPAQIPAGGSPGDPLVWVTEDAVRVVGSGASAKRTDVGGVLSNPTLERADCSMPPLTGVACPSDLDALAFTLTGVEYAAQQIDRRGRSPHRVIGKVPTKRQREGDVVCFTGLTSGVDQCGRVDGWSTCPLPPSCIAPPAICARAKGRNFSDHGDSGAAVYTKPNRWGEVRALGILSRSSPGGWIFGGTKDMCYTPIETILDTFGAELPTGSFTIRP